jgi:hypothetical protein
LAILINIHRSRLILRSINTWLQLLQALRTTQEHNNKTHQDLVHLAWEISQSERRLHKHTSIFPPGLTHPIWVEAPHKVLGCSINKANMGQVQVDQARIQVLMPATNVDVQVVLRRKIPKLMVRKRHRLSLAQGLVESGKRGTQHEEFFMANILSYSIKPVSFTFLYHGCARQYLVAYNYLRSAVQSAFFTQWCQHILEARDVGKSPQDATTYESFIAHGLYICRKVRRPEL